MKSNSIKRDVEKFNNLMLSLDVANDIETISKAIALACDETNPVFTQLSSYEIKSFMRKSFRAACRYSSLNGLEGANNLANKSGFNRFVNGESVGVM